MDLRVGALTVSTVETCSNFPPTAIAATMAAFPCETALANPAALIVAIAVDAEAHAAFVVRSLVFPLE